MIINKIRFYNNSNNLWLLYSPHSHDNMKETIIKWAKTSTQKDTKKIFVTETCANGLRCGTCIVLLCINFFVIHMYRCFKHGQRKHASKSVQQLYKAQSNSCTRFSQSLKTKLPIKKYETSQICSSMKRVLTISLSN